MKSKRLLGWFLLVIGVAIIFASLYFSFNIFTNRGQAPEVFKIDSKIDSEEVDISSISPENIQEQMEKIVEQQVKNMIPPEFMSGLLNLISWSIFAGILIFGGSRIATIGIKLARV